VVNQTQSALLCLSPSLNALAPSLPADRHPLSVAIHFEMSSDGDGGRLLQFHADLQHLANFTYVHDPAFFPFAEEDRPRKFYTDQSHLVLEVDELHLWLWLLRACCHESWLL